MAIDISKYMVDLRGKQYLPVAPRIVMMRESNPEWSVITEPVLIDGLEPMVKATVLDNENNVMATAHKTITSFRGGAFEKAETGAIGRALSLCGFGTIQAGDMEEGDEIADSPVTATSPPPKAKQNAPQSAPKSDTVRIGELFKKKVKDSYNSVPHMMQALAKNESFNDENVKNIQAGGSGLTASSDAPRELAVSWYNWLIERKEG